MFFWYNELRLLIGVFDLIMFDLIVPSLFIGLSIYFLCKKIGIFDWILYFILYYIFANVIGLFVKNDILIMNFANLLLLCLIIPLFLFLGTFYNRSLTFIQKVFAYISYAFFLIIYNSNISKFVLSFELEYKILFYFFIMFLPFKLFVRGVPIFLSENNCIKNWFNPFLSRFKNIKQNVLVDNFDFYTNMLAIISFILIYLIIRFNPLNIKFIGSEWENNFSDGLFSIIKNATPILSLYGMYFGFLQFVANTAEEYIYMGENKLNYILNRSFAYQLSKSKVFYFFIMSFCLIPFVSIILNRNILLIDFQKDLNIIWQIDFFFLLFLYLFLVITMIKTVSTTIELRIGQGKWIETKILTNYKFFYANLFWRSYRLGEPSLFFNSLEKDLNKINEYSEADQLLNGVFDRIFEEFKYKFFNERWTNLNKPELLIYYSKYINEFTNFMKKRNKVQTISSNSWFYIFKIHQQILELIINYNKNELLKVDESVYDIESNSFTKIYKLLFDTLILRRDTLSLLISDYFDSETNRNNYFLLHNTSKYRDIFKIREYKCRSLLKLYLSVNDNSIDIGRINRYNNENFKEFYSKVCFEFLRDEGRLRTFDEKDVLNKIILSMNNEYSLAFMLYQLLYTDYTEWDDNIEFYDTEIKKLMSCDEEQQNYLFEQAKEKILSTNISHRITDKLLDNLWTKRNEKITDFYWFKQFGRRHQMSELKIVYVQWLLSGKEYSFSSRFNFIYDSLSFGKVLTRAKKSEKCIKTSVNKLHWKRVRNKEKMDNFCREYLLLTDKLDSIFTNDFYSYKQNDIQLSVEYLLNTNKVDLSNVIENLSVSSLLRLEWILRFRVRRYNRDFSYTSRTIFDSMTSNDPFYWSGGEGVLEFYILKIIDSSYDDLYKDTQFLDGLKRSLISTLNFHNFTINKYVELISEKVSTIYSISILQKEEIICKLNDLLDNTATKNNQSKPDYKKPYRYR